MRRRRLRSEDNRISAPSLIVGQILMAALIQTLAVAEYLSLHHSALALGTNQSSTNADARAEVTRIGAQMAEAQELPSTRPSFRIFTIQ